LCQAGENFGEKLGKSWGKVRRKNLNFKAPPTKQKKQQKKPFRTRFFIALNAY